MNNYIKLLKSMNNYETGKKWTIVRLLRSTLKYEFSEELSSNNTSILSDKNNAATMKITCKLTNLKYLSHGL
jgi:hypothetical protein